MSSDGKSSGKVSDSFEQFLSGVLQHICCSFYRFRDMRGSTVLFLAHLA
jgi:hypothetical protein